LSDPEIPVQVEAAEQGEVLPFAMLTQTDLCRILKTDRKGVDRLVHEEGLPRVKVGSRNRFLLSDVEAWIASRRSVATPTEAGRARVDPPEREAAAASLGLSPTRKRRAG
jgi:excisionase family DNA binding protein